MSGAGRARLQDLVGAVAAVVGHAPPESFSTPAVSCAVVAELEARYGRHDPLWASFRDASAAVGILSC